MNEWKLQDKPPRVQAGKGLVLETFTRFRTSD